MRGKRDRALGRLEFVLHDVDVEANCLTRQDHEVRIKSPVSLRIDSVPAGSRKAPPAWRKPQEMYPLVRDAFARELRAAVAACSWEEVIKGGAKQVIEPGVAAAAEPEMTGLGLTTRSFQIKAIDFPEGSEPSLALRRAAASASASARRASQVGPGEADGPA